MARLEYMRWQYSRCDGCIYFRIKEDTTCLGCSRYHGDKFRAESDFVYYDARVSKEDMAWPYNLYLDLCSKRKETPWMPKLLSESVIESALDTLSEQEKFVIRCRYKKGDRFIEIAGSLDVPARDVMRLWEAALKKLSLNSVFAGLLLGVKYGSANTAQVTLDTQLQDLRLPARIMRRLRAFRTVGDIVGFTEKELLKIDGIGKRSIAEIKEALSSVGFSLREI